MSETAQTAAEAAKVPVVPAAGPAPVKFSKTKAAIGKMAKKWKTVPDMTTPEGYAKGQQAKRELTPMRITIEKEKKVQKETAQTHIADINTKGNELIDMIIAIEKPIYDAKKAQDEAVAKKKREDEEKEERRTLAIEAKVEEIQDLTEGLLGADLKTLEERLAEANKITITDAVYMEFVEQASQVLDQTKTQLINAVTTAKAQAKEKVEQDLKHKKQQEQLDAQQADIKETERKNKLQESIGRIRMAPVDLIGSSVDNIQKAIDKLGNIDPVTDYGDLADDANSAINDTKAKLEGMKKQRQGMDDQQAEIDRNNQAEADRQQQEADDQTRKEKEEYDAKIADELAAELKVRMPEDVWMREFAISLCSVPFPEVQTPEMVALVREVGVQLADINQYIIDNTQDPA